MKEEDLTTEDTNVEQIEDTNITSIVTTPEDEPKVYSFTKKERKKDSKERRKSNGSPKNLRITPPKTTTLNVKLKEKSQSRKLPDSENSEENSNEPMSLRQQVDFAPRPFTTQVSSDVLTMSSDTQVPLPVSDFLSDVSVWQPFGTVYEQDPLVIYEQLSE